jgi:dextranase
MDLADFYPTKGTFPPGETIELVVIVEATTAEIANLHVAISHLDKVIDTFIIPVSLSKGENQLSLKWRSSAASPRGYGVTAELCDHSGALLDTISTAFDTLLTWTAFPRYGFLTDLTPHRLDIPETLDALARFHINGLQFYDWQYRHDRLLPPETDYIDPLGRTLSLDTVSQFIKAAHDRGMAAMPYLAVYAASIEFWGAHPDWALYDASGQAITFEGFLGLMDSSPGSPWIDHLLGECDLVLDALPFDGLHVDQYGEPKEGFNYAGDPVDIPAAFVAFIQALKTAHPQAAVVFNAVGGWPIESLATAPQDLVYIEIWPPDIHYRDIRHIVTGARAMSGGKAVVIALYLPANRPENILLADALIFSLGGSRIELGEQARLLADPYFPKHQAIEPDFKTVLRRYYDFVVRYGEFLGPAAALLEDFKVTVTPGVWVVARSCAGWLVLSLINVAGLDDPRWDQIQSPPKRLPAVSVQFRPPHPVRQAWWSSADLDDLSLAPLPWTTNDDTVSATLPDLNHWAIIAFELEPRE